MSSVGIVSCDKWQNKIKEDIFLKMALIDLGIDAEIISWQQPLNRHYDLLILRSVWGYQNEYRNFKNWLLYLKKENIPLLNSPELIMTNILKDKQFEILEKNHIQTVKTFFVSKNQFYEDCISKILSSIDSELCVVKPSISGSGENTYLISKNGNRIAMPSILEKSEIFNMYYSSLCENEDLKIMFQPFIPQIIDGEYSCIFINGNLTHTMLRFPSVFHDKKSSILVKVPPKRVLELALNVENIRDFKNYLYMRVDMVLINGIPQIMEVELAEPDLLTKYIDDIVKRDEIVRILARETKGRMKV